MKISKLIEVQEIAVKIAMKVPAGRKIFMNYQTGQGKTSLCLGLAALKLHKYPNVLIVNQSQDLTFRDFKKAHQLFNNSHYKVHLIQKVEPDESLQAGLSFMCGDLFFKLTQSNPAIIAPSTFIIVDEFDSLLFNSGKDPLTRNRVIKSIDGLLGFTGSDLQGCHKDFIERTLGSYYFNLNIRSMDEQSLKEENVEVHQLKLPYRQRLLEIAKSQVCMVPVIIILEHGAELLQSTLEKASIPVFNLCTMDPSSVESSMRLFNTKNSETYSVYIINDEQGRGLDFESNTEIEKSGGVYLLVGQLPYNFLQFRQYLGRTARIGNKGKYSVILQDKDSKNLEGRLYLKQKLEKLKNDDLQQVQQLSQELEKQYLADGILKPIADSIDEKTLTQNSFEEHKSSENLINLLPVKSAYRNSSLECKEQIIISMELNNDTASLLLPESDTNNLNLQQRRKLKQERKQGFRYSKRLNNLTRKMDEIDEGYFASYNNPLIHKEMLSDHVRNEAYKNAIIQSCQGKVVVDVGTGSGVLSILAAQAGAEHVFGIEFTDFIVKARENVRKNEVEDRVTLYQELAEECFLPVERVDVVISEWMGYFLLCEAMLPSVLDVKNRYLGQGGIVIPSHANLLLAAFQNKSEMEGVDLSAVYQSPICDAVIGICQPEQVICQAAPIFNIDLQESSTFSNAFEQEFEIVTTSAGPVAGFVGWFDLTMCEGQIMTTSPFSTPTHWQQTLFSFSLEIICGLHQSIKGTISVAPREDNHRALLVKLKINCLDGRVQFTQEYFVN